VQGRDVELLEAAASFAASSTLIEGEFSLRASVAAIAARAGEHDRARATLDLLARAGLDTLPRSSVWLTGMSAIVEAAWVLGDEALARETYDLLLPFADRPVMPSLAVACLGSTERFLGLAALTLGKADLAVAHLEAAIEANRRLGNRPLVAMCQGELAQAVLAQAAPGAAARAVALFDAAAAAAEGMEMPQRAAVWRSERDAVAPATPRAGSVRREGRGWVIAADDRRAFVGDLVGMTYLAQLLRHPGREIPALTLAGAGPLPPEAHQEVFDEQAKAAYAAKARQLSEELADAEAVADRGRAEPLRDELDQLVEHVEAAIGLHGRSRTFMGRAERARTAVRKALKRAMAEITASDPVLGRLIWSSITTGVDCSYSPPSGAEIVWSVDDAG
jgi:tetratricopeptide (TPR) repeat protein